MALDEYTFWQFLDFFILYNNTCCVEFDISAKFKHLLQLRRVLEANVTKFREQEQASKSDFERKLIRGRIKSVDTLKTFEEQLSQIESQTKHFDKREEIDSKVSERLKNIFNHYSKAQCMRANHTFTFEKLKKDNETLSSSEWIAFCRDFDLLDKNHPAAELFGLFKKIAKGNGSLAFAEFMKALKHFSDIEFKDIQNESERISKMWDKLELHDPLVGLL